MEPESGINQFQFSTDQLDILNRLIFDASIRVKDIRNLSLSGTAFELPIERRKFEAVTRKKFLWWTRTYLEGMVSTLRFENVDEIGVSGSLDLEGKHMFISGIRLMEDHLSIDNTANVSLNIKITPATRITLIDHRPGDFGKGIVEGRTGFTKTEWLDYLKLHSAGRMFDDRIIE
jgi:hypothetical protein